MHDSENGRDKITPGKRSVLRKTSGLEWLDEEDKIRPVRGERALWRAVILQALEDAASNTQKPAGKYHKIEALNWLEGRGEDFAMVCDLAGLLPKDVRCAAKRALLNGCKWRLPAGQGAKAKKKAAQLAFETKSSLRLRGDLRGNVPPPTTLTLLRA